MFLMLYAFSGFVPQCSHASDRFSDAFFNL